MKLDTGKVGAGICIIEQDHSGYLDIILPGNHDNELDVMHMSNQKK